MLCIYRYDILQHMYFSRKIHRSPRRRYIGQNLRQMVDRPDGIFLFRLHKADGTGTFGSLEFRLFEWLGCRKENGSLKPLSRKKTSRNRIKKHQAR